jgi:hypothetical protein
MTTPSYNLPWEHYNVAMLFISVFLLLWLFEAQDRFFRALKFRAAMLSGVDVNVAPTCCALMCDRDLQIILSLSAAWVLRQLYSITQLVTTLRHYSTGDLPAPHLRSAALRSLSLSREPFRGHLVVCRRVFRSSCV